MNKIDVGEPHPVWAKTVGDSGYFNVDAGHVVVGLPFVTDKDVTAFGQSAKFGVVKYRDIGIAATDFPGIPEMLLPFRAEEFFPEEMSFVGDEVRRLLTFVLVESPSGQVKAIRAATINPMVTRKIDRIVQHHMVNPVDDGRFVDQATEFYAQYPTWQSAKRVISFSKLGD